MRSFKRAPTPDILLENSAKWNKKWASRRAEKPNASFYWYKKVNQTILPILTSQTQQHCSYCDGEFPLRPANKTIDHFKPKSRVEFYQFAFSWQNLYLACRHCQNAKKEKYSELLLAPDNPTYSFDRYFDYNYNSHKIEVSQILTEDSLKYKRAKKTIEIFDFNETGLVEARKAVFSTWDEKNSHIDDFNFRFMFF